MHPLDHRVDHHAFDPFADGLDPQEAQLASGMRPGDPGYGEAPPGWLASGAPAP